MALYDIAHRIGAKLGIFKRRDAHPFSIAAEEGDRLAAGAEGGLSELFFSHQGRLVHKWVHYLPLYERHFSAYRGKPIKMLEIGVFQGGSLEMWRKYFGSDAVLYGIDINPECAARVSPPNQVRIGSQDDPEFLRSVVAEMNGVDIILDDGSHIGRHQWASFETLFPLLNDGGLYAIEDLHSSYWPGVLEGGYGRRGTGIDLLKTLIDDMHARFHGAGVKAATGAIGMHVYDSVAFIEKGPPVSTGHLRVPPG